MKYNKIALVFPGQDSRYVGMGKELYDKFKCVRDVYDKASQVLKIEKAINDGGDLFIEVGPGRVLSNMIEGIDSSIPKLNVEDVQSVEKTVKELTG